MDTEDVPKPTLWQVYHALWGLARDAPGYCKRDWNWFYNAAVEEEHSTEDTYLRRRMVRLARIQGVSDEAITSSLGIAASDPGGSL